MLTKFLVQTLYFCNYVHDTFDDAIRLANILGHDGGKVLAVVCCEFKL